MDLLISLYNWINRVVFYLFKLALFCIPMLALGIVMMVTIIGFPIGLGLCCNAIYEFAPEHLELDDGAFTWDDSDVDDWVLVINEYFCILYRTIIAGLINIFYVVMGFGFITSIIFIPTGLGFLRLTNRVSNPEGTSVEF